MKKIQTQAALTTLNTNATLTMSSREIAELLGSRHDNVKVAIERLAAKEVVTFTATQEPTRGGGKPVTLYHVGKRDSYVIVAQLSPEFTARLVDRWQELEAQATAQQASKLPTTFAEALRLAAELEEQKETLRLQNEAMKPLAQVGAAVAARKQTTIMDFARMLPGVNTKQVKNKLVELGYIRKRQSATALYATSNKFFGGKRFSVVTLTEKGMELVSRLYLQGELQMLKGQTPVSAGELNDILIA